MISSNHCPSLVLNADYRPLSYFPLSIWSWKDTVKAVFLDRVNIVEEYDQTIFVEEAHILNNVDKIQHIPTFIVQGRYDVVCPTRSAWELHKALPNSTLSIIPDSGHSMGEFGIAKELVNFTDSV